MSDSLADIRKKLHRNPELSGHEYDTANLITEYLRDSKPDQILEGIGGTGVMAQFLSKNPQNATSILIRAELDAISVDEKTGLSYASQNSDIMHGCGHDGHMTILLALAQKLKKRQFDNKNVYLLFQPAEETGEGAGQVLSDDRFKKLKIDHAFALHNIPEAEENLVIIKENVFAVASCGIEFKFEGKSSHAAHPEEGVNPSMAIATFINQADALLNEFRNKDSLNKAVNTFIKLGEPAYGISPGTGNLGFTLRSKDDEEVRNTTKQLVDLSAKIAESFSVEIHHKLKEPFSTTINSPNGCEVVRKSAEKLNLQVKRLEIPFTWSEDFGEFGKKFPITLFGLGAGKQSAPLHSENYDFNNKLISVGADLFYTIIQEF